MADGRRYDVTVRFGLFGLQFRTVRVRAASDAEAREMALSAPEIDGKHAPEVIGVQVVR